MRDLDLASQIARDTWCVVAFTITGFDKKTIDFLEPGASPPEDRINALAKIKEEHPEIQTGVHYMPIVPLLEDSDEDLEEVLRRTKEAKCDYILFAAGMSLRDKQGDFFKKKFKERYPDLYDQLLSIYSEGNMWANVSYSSLINKKVYDLCKKFKVAIRAKRWIPKDFRRVNYIISEQLLNEAYESQILGNYDKQMQWAGLNMQNLDKSILDVPNYQKILRIPNRIADKIITMVKKFKKKKDLTSFF